MVFNSVEFVVLFSIVYVLYILLRKNLRAQNILMTVAGYVFYGWWDWRFLSLLMVSTVMDYWCAILIADSGNPRIRKTCLWISMVGDLSMLCFFKYFNFARDNLQTAFTFLGFDVTLYTLNVILPVGISFYTFQTLCYTFDVYRRKVEPARDFLNYCFYVNYFPTLVAGPIERGNSLLPQILRPRTIGKKQVLEGIYLIYWGLFLKVFVADNLAKFVDPVFSAPPPYNGSEVLLATYAFAFQIYGDFAGYSFMAIGVGWLLGFDLIYNFKRPYFSKNIAEFWRRWHISLSSWFRDYVFSPYYAHLDKKNIFKNLSFRTRHNILFFISLMVTELLLGFWHGANWNFGLFGLYHGLLIWAYYYTRNWWDRMPAVLQVILMFHLACLGWLIFRVPSIAQLGEMLHALLFNFDLSGHIGLTKAIKDFSFFVWIVVLVEIIDSKKDDALGVLMLPLVFRWIFYVILLCLIVIWGEFGGKQFIYFQF